jgi:1,4-alpha-glucan branching enzyme
MIRTVWAPYANSMELISDQQRRAMQRGTGGYWQIDVPES